MQQLSLRKPHQVLWLSIPVILAITLLSKVETIDFQLHDTYLLITPFHLGLLLGLFVALLGGIYWLLRHRKLVRWMTITHLVLTLAGVLLLALRFSAPHFFAPENANGQTDWAGRQGIATVTVMVTLGLVLAQILFLVNVVLSKKRR